MSLYHKPHRFEAETNGQTHDNQHDWRPKLDALVKLSIDYSRREQQRQRRYKVDGSALWKEACFVLLVSITVTVQLRDRDRIFPLVLAMVSIVAGDIYQARQRWCYYPMGGLGQMSIHWVVL